MQEIEEATPNTLVAKEGPQQPKSYLDVVKITVKESGDDMLKRIRMANKLKEEEREKAHKERKQ